MLRCYANGRVAPRPPLAHRSASGDQGKQGQRRRRWSRDTTSIMSASAFRISTPQSLGIAISCLLDVARASEAPKRPCPVRARSTQTATAVGRSPSPLAGEGRGEGFTTDLATSPAGPQSNVLLPPTATSKHSPDGGAAHNCQTTSGTGPVATLKTVPPVQWNDARFGPRREA